MAGDRLPPGTQRIEDREGSKILLAPQPNADPNQPLNWSKFRKALHMTILGFYALMVFAILCVAVPLWQDFNEELGMSYDALNNGYATNMATLSVGCIIFVPIALRIGRRPVYIITALVLLAAAVWQANQRTVGDMIGANAISGLAGAVNEAIFQVTVSDLFFVHQRGTMNGVYLVLVMFGNYLGPVAAGYVAVNQSWPWAFWYCAIFMGVVTIAMIFFLEESKYTPTVMEGREVVTSAQEDQLTKVTSTTKGTLGSISVDATEAAANNVRKRLVDIDYSIPMKPYRKRLSLWSLEKQGTTERRSWWMHLYQPFQILATFPAVMFTALQYGFCIAMLAILAVTQSTLYPFPPYNFTTIGVGNMNIPPCVGAILGSLFGGPLNDYFILQVAKRRGGIYEPETRLWLFLVPGFCMPIGLFMYGLTISKGMAWQINAVGAGFIGAAIGGCGDISLTYCQDCYQYILGDALTSVVFVRNVISTALVFAITPWMNNMGVYDMFVLLGCLSIAVALTCVPMIIWGPPAPFCGAVHQTPNPQEKFQDGQTIAPKPHDHPFKSRAADSILSGDDMAAFGGQTPTIIVLKEGTDQSQGKGQVISNINACLAVQDTIKATLGPYGGDLLLVDAGGKQTITNDGATVMKLLDVVHPAARILVDIARSQDAEVGDGTTSVVVLAGEILKEVKELVEQGVSTQIIIKGLRRASEIAINKVKEIAVSTNETNKRETLRKLAATAMSSKLIHRNADFFTKMVVDAVLSLDQDDLNEKLIGIKKITGGALEDSLFVDGVAFKKTFSYAGFEQQPKTFKNPKIVCLNVELELKAEKDNAEVRVEQVSEYQAIVDAEWQIIYDKMEALYKTGAKVVLSRLPIGDLATQYFADRDIFCAGRVAAEDLERVCQATGATVQSTCTDIQPSHLGTCGLFEERQIGGERYNLFSDCPQAKTCTLILRGGAEQFIAEVERSLHDAIMIVKRALRNNTIVAGGGATEMEVSGYLHRYADKNVPHKQQAVVKAFAKALEIIPRQLCDNAGFDATDILNRLRVEHRKGHVWAGVDFDHEGVRNNMDAFVWEPALVKVNAISAAVEAACLILSVDETIKNEESQAPQAPQRGLPPGAAQRALRGRGRGMPRR